MQSQKRSQVGGEVLTLGKDWRKIDERVAGDSRNRLGGLDPYGTIFSTSDGAIFGRIYPVNILDLNLVVNKQSLEIALLHAHSLRLQKEEFADLPDFNKKDFALYNVIEKEVIDSTELLQYNRWTY